MKKIMKVRKEGEEDRRKEEKWKKEENEGKRKEKRVKDYVDLRKGTETYIKSS